ncbi:uncharacterized protein [Penaeus vannamei]|nr:uncharacterized protein LOC113813925 [Penaeus vannamei]
MDLRDSPVLMFTASTPTPTPTDESDAPASPPVRPDVAREAARATAGLDLPSPVAPKKPRYTPVPTQFQHQFTPVLNQYRQQFTPAPKPFQAQLPASDSSYMWPPGVHALAGLDELLICPSKDSVFKIKNAEKEVLFTAETEDEVECCWWTGSKETTSMFIVKNTDHQEVFYVRRTFEPNGCFLTNSSTSIDVTFPSEVPVGHVITEGRKYVLTNPSADVLLRVWRDGLMCGPRPYKIYSDDGEEVGSIECHNSAKNRLVFPADQQIRNKVLLLGTALDIITRYRCRRPETQASAAVKLFPLEKITPKEIRERVLKV